MPRSCFSSPQASNCDVTLDSALLSTLAPTSNPHLHNWLFFFVVNFVIHWNETAMDLHVFPIPIPPPTSLSTRSHNWLLKGGFKRRTHVLGSWLEMLIAGSYSLTLCSWNSPGKNTGVGCHALLQRIFLTQGSNLGLLNYMNILYCMSHQGSPSLTLPFPKFD